MKAISRRRLALLLLALLVAGLPARAAVLARWIQIGPGDFGADPLAGVTVLARALVGQGEACPSLDIDGTPAAMATRFDGIFPAPVSPQPRPAPGFAVKACEAVVPPSHAVARIGGVAMRLPPAAVRRLVVLGDSGCRRAQGKLQDCADPAAFPFARIAARAAAEHPDLVIHVGDYFYRDIGGDPEGPAFPWGDNWPAWQADFFAPAGPLLQAAPWVMIRGNHENCGRGAQGWFALLEPAPLDPALLACRPETEWAGAPFAAAFRPGYVVPLGGRRNLVVFDSSGAPDRPDPARPEPRASIAARYRQEWEAILARLPGGSASLLATHKPLYGMVATAPETAGNTTLQYMIYGTGQGVPPRIGLVLSGHLHAWQHLDFADAARHVPQLVIGTGGDWLDPPLDPTSPVFARRDMVFRLHAAADPAQATEILVRKAFSERRFGYAVLVAVGKGFRITFHDPGGRVLDRCTLTLNRERRLDCAPAG